ncbi:apaH [Symbiodinium natans]|uniref:ApaH protein n=1 Tax=Symbiodinium natans TaxID=878477 RepID=A0A812PF40_9DINO|nr:apaH [Symbiodinium natans]
MWWRLLAFWRLRLVPGVRAVAACCVLALLILSLSGHSLQGRVVVVGDVHGCADELAELLEVVSFNRARDELVFVGDLIGKGPAPKAVVRLARRLGAAAVQGNHEFNLLSWRKRGAPLPDDQNVISARYAETVAELEEEDWAWLESLPLHLVLPLPRAHVPVVVVHAGLVPGGGRGCYVSLQQHGYPSDSSGWVRGMR